MKVKLSDIKVLTDEQLNLLNRKDLLVVTRSWFKKGLVLEEIVGELEERLKKHEAYACELQERLVEIENKLCRIQSKIFSPSSEKKERNKTKNENEKTRKPRSTIRRLPSEKYPDADIIEKHITLEKDPDCPCCGRDMVDSGMFETSEYLSVIPKQYFIVRQLRHKYRCSSCHGSIVTAPALPRIIPKSSYSDELIIDVTLSKFCDLIPVERYCQMAARQGFVGLPPHSLITAIIAFAFFLRLAYERLKEETLNTQVLLADETRHRMLEGDDKKIWQLWSFLGEKACFYECHNTRSGDVAASVLIKSICQFLLTDLYGGYGKAIREANKVRAELGLPLIQAANCNSHARRLFLPPKGEDGPQEIEFMVEKYQEIYQLESLTKDQPPERIIEIRQEMLPIFKEMKENAEQSVGLFPKQSSWAEGLNYFLKCYSGLTLFLSNPGIPIDNNASERLLRSPVVGRKTWYGTHSKEGAEASAIHFSLIESCKLNKINPREYYKDLVRRLHAKEPPITPSEYKKLSNSS